MSVILRRARKSCPFNAATRQALVNEINGLTGVVSRQCSSSSAETNDGGSSRRGSARQGDTSTLKTLLVGGSLAAAASSVQYYHMNQPGLSTPGSVIKSPIRQVRNKKWSIAIEDHHPS